MSKSPRPALFDDWIGREFRKTGGFTALVILLSIGELSITPLRSTHFHVIGDNLDWTQMAALFSGAGPAWDGALFATMADKRGGPIADAVARQELQALAERLKENRLILNENHFFDRWGRRLRIDEVMLQ